MKYIFSLVLFCLIFQNALGEKLSRKMKLAKFALTLRNIAKEKEKRIRKLQTDKSEESATAEATTPPVGNYTETPIDAPENTNATAANTVVNATKPVSVAPKQTEEKTSKVQVTKFHGFNIEPKRNNQPAVVKFGVFIYFLGRPIVQFIVLRLRITYARLRLRGLQTEAVAAESVRTDCTITDPDLAGKILSDEEGKNVNYDCSANATAGDATTANFTLNTDVPLTMVNANGTTESLDFKEVNFNGDSNEAANSLQESTQELSGKIAVLKNSTASFDKYILTITGTLLLENSRRIRNLIENNEDVTMNIKNNKDEMKSYLCQIQMTKSGSQSSLTCDTSSDPLKTSVGKIHLSSGNSTDKTLVSVEMLNSEGNSTTPVEYNGGRNVFYSKSSSGLSGGAIAGIVIACVVVLAAASIAAIMLRKPSPPIDNTTVVNLKSENI